VALAEATAPPLPTFLIIGAQKSGTRWLRINLGLHPEIFTASEELAFFNSARFTRKGLDWYRVCFKGWRDEPFVGEATPGYMISVWRAQRAAKRIDKTLPGVRLLALLRNPVDRAYSAFVHHMRHGRIPPDSDLVAYARNAHTEDPYHVIAAGRYGEILKPYVKRFQSRLAIMLLDDVERDARHCYRQAVLHVGANPSFAPAGLEDVRFSNKVPRKSPYAAQGRQKRPLTDDERRSLYELFADDIPRLEQLIQRDLSHWAP
jgi:hypothetical protein